MTTSKNGIKDYLFTNRFMTNRTDNHKAKEISIDIMEHYKSLCKSAKVPFTLESMRVLPDRVHKLIRENKRMKEQLEVRQNLSHSSIVYLCHIIDTLSDFEGDEEERNKYLEAELKEIRNLIGWCKEE